MTREDLEAAAARVIADGPVPLRVLARKIPADRGDSIGKITVSSLARWIVNGRKGVYLDGARLAGKGWCSSERALARFAAALAAQEVRGEAPAAPCERERRAKSALAELDSLKGGKG